MTTMHGPLRRARRIGSGGTAVSCGDVDLTYDRWGQAVNAAVVLKRELREPHWQGHDTRVGGM